MAKLGSYIVTLNEAHLKWGVHRYTGTRGVVYGEGYIPIPIDKARALELYNSNKTGGKDVYGVNLFHCESKDGLFCGVLKSQGCVSEGEAFAKQFSGNNDLKSVGSWYAAINAETGDQIKVSITGNDTIEIEKL